MKPKGFGAVAHVGGNHEQVAVSACGLPSTGVDRDPQQFALSPQYAKFPHYVRFRTDDSICCCLSSSIDSVRFYLESVS